jgi:hypothetical protein
LRKQKKRIALQLNGALEADRRDAIAGREPKLAFPEKWSAPTPAFFFAIPLNDRWFLPDTGNKFDEFES